MTDCLSDEQLDLLASQEATADQSTPWMAHVEACPTCRRLLDECRENLTFAGTVRQAFNSGGPESDVGDYLEEARAEGRRLDDIPGYEILHELHRGAQGVVYQAIQASTARQVAIKFMREGVHASRATRKRFEREIELVAGLKHPGIIRVFDSGLSIAGHQYYVMDYVHGLPLNHYVWHEQLTLEKALELFATVCEAVNYAHQHGVIHRDLKPSNILVDGQGTPHVLDFGLAKPLLEQAGTWASMSGEVVGTLPYMSPEQARGGREPIDIRSDVYSLGVVLYQVVTGQYPYPVAGPVAEVLNHIIESQPMSPGRAWPRDTGGIRESERPRARRTGNLVDEDLETIILRALAKDPGRRYPNVAALLQDVRHYLSSQPIEARRDAGLHVLRRSLARYRAAVAVTLASAVVVGALAIVVYFMYLNQTFAYQRADAERIRAVETQGRLARALLRLGDVAMQRGDVDDARVQYQAALALNQHLAAARMENLAYQAMLANTHMRLGDVAIAMQDRERAIEHYRGFSDMMAQLVAAVPDHSAYQDHLASSYERLSTLLEAPRPEEAQDYARQAMDLRRRMATEPQASAAALAAYARGLLTCRARELRDPVVALELARMAVQQGGHADPAALGVLALALECNGQHEAALETREQALNLVPPEQSTLRAALKGALDPEALPLTGPDVNEQPAEGGP